MGIWVIIPVKPLNRAKSRLSQVLSPEERRQLAESMLRHVLSVVRHIPQVMGTLVVSRDTKALAIAREYGVRTLQETGSPELNTALMRATQFVMRWNATGVLILPADLPLISEEDVSGILTSSKSLPSVVIATDEAEDGTNALLVRPPGMFPYSYGAGSYRRHLELARDSGVQAITYRSERLSLDIDVPDDLKFYRELLRGYAPP
jgi:2-phospho-L-lactate guanylyltransferase